MKEDYIYRGESESYPKISSSLYREYPDIADSFGITVVQNSILSSAKHFVGKIDDNDLLTQLQHFGCSTNLIDFTTDYLIALYFACSAQPHKDGRIIFLRREPTQSLPQRARRTALFLKRVYLSSLKRDSYSPAL